MNEILTTLTNISVQVFVITSMLSVGFSYTIKEILAPLRNVRGVIVTLLANFVLVPLLAYAVTQFIGLERPMAIGVLLLSTAAGAPALIKLTQMANGNLALGASLLVLLLIATILYMPLVLPLALPGVAVDAGAIAGQLIRSMLLPLGIGLVVDSIWPQQTTRWQPLLGKISNIALVILIASTLLANLGSIIGVFGTGAILAALLVVAGGFITGYLLGGSSPDVKGVVGLATAQRNIAAATLVATQNFSDPDVVVMVIVGSVVTMILLFPLARWLGKRSTTEPPTTVEEESGSQTTSQPVG